MPAHRQSAGETPQPLPGTAILASFRLHRGRTLLLTTTSNVLRAFPVPGGFPLLGTWC